MKTKVWSGLRCHSVLQWSNYRPFLRTGSVKKFTQTLKFLKKKNYMSFVPKRRISRVTLQWMCQWNLFFGKTQKFVKTLIDFRSSNIDVNRFILELYDIWSPNKPCFHFFFFNQVALSLKPTCKILILREMLIIHTKSPGAIFGSKSLQIHFFV